MSLDAEVGRHPGQDDLTDVAFTELQHDIVILRAIDLMGAGYNGLAVLDEGLVTLEPVGARPGETLEKVMHDINMFDRRGSLNLEGFTGSGADWLERYKPLIEDGKTVIASPHKVYGPENNDVMLQLRKRGIGKVTLAGMSANLCVESHLRELLERGFEVAVVKNATAGARHPDLGDGYQSALVNYGYIANEVVTTEEIVSRLKETAGQAG